MKYNLDDYNKVTYRVVYKEEPFAEEKRNQIYNILTAPKPLNSKWNPDIEVETYKEGLMFRRYEDEFC